MKFSEITEAKERVAKLKAEAARLEREIKQAELCAEMNRIEVLMAKNHGLINGLRAALSEGNRYVLETIIALQNENKRLESEWNVVYAVYFSL